MTTSVSELFTEILATIAELPPFNLEAITDEMADLFTRENLIRQAATSIVILRALEQLVDDVEASDLIATDEATA